MAVRLVLADDNEPFRQFVKRLLGQDMQVIGESTRGEEAVNMSREMCPHVVLMDIDIPGLDAIAATRQIKAASPETKVILMTVHDEHSYLSSTGKTGADFLLRKREVRAQILARIRGVLSSFGPAWDGSDRRGKEPGRSQPWDGRERRRNWDNRERG